jgi:hypothetical protein
MLVELLTLRLPHKRDRLGLTPELLQLAMMDEPLPDLTALRPDAPVRLVRLINRCLASTPELRPDAHEVAKELRDIKFQMEGRPISREASTDVDEPTIEELHRRMQAASGNAAVEAQVVAGAGHLDLDATTEPPPSPRVGEEVFFVRATPTSARSTALPIPETAHVPRPTQDLTTPDPLAPFAAAAAHQGQGAPAPSAAISVMPVVALAGQAVGPRPLPSGAAEFLAPPAAATPPSDTIFYDPDRAGRLLDRAPLVAPPSPVRAAPSERRQRSFVNSGPMIARPPEARAVTPSPQPAHPQTLRMPGFTSTSEPGWQTPAPKPPRRVARQRVVLGLAFATPILIGLAFAPLVLPGRPVASQGDTIPPASVSPPVHALASATAEPVSAPSVASATDVAAATTPQPSQSQAPVVPARSVVNVTRTATTKPKGPAPAKLDDEWRLLTDKP